MATSSSKRESLTVIKQILTQLRDTDWKRGTDMVEQLLDDVDGYDTVPEYTHVEEQKHVLQAEITRLNKELQEKTVMCQTFERTLNERESIHSSSMDNRVKRPLQEENKKLRDHISLLEKDIERYKIERQEQKKPHQEVMERQKTIIETLTNENEDLKGSIKSHEYVSHDLSKQVETLNKQLKKIKEEKEAINLQLKNSQKECQKTKQELIETRTRLSKLMSSQMTDNNPDIADLSDQNRPDKLAERYQELYDNQWSDAFEGLDIICSHYSDEQKVIFLQQILKEARNFCEKQAFEQTKNLERALLTGSSDKPLPDVMKKQLKEMKKAMVPINKGVVTKNFLASFDEHGQYKMNRKEMKPFIEECINVCWIMAMSDPPIVFGPDLQQGDIIDYSFYRSYTTKGSRVNYEVWPPLLVNEGGALLTKGVVEAIGHSGGRADRVITKSKNSSTSRPHTAPAGKQLRLLDADGNRIENVLDAKSRSSRSKNLPTTSGTYVEIPASAMSYRGSAYKKNYEQQNFSKTSRGATYNHQF